MKLSLAWIFDHIQGVNIKNIDMNDLMVQFSAKVAEIEDHYPISINLDEFALAQVTKINPESCVVYCQEWKKEINLPVRKDAQKDLYFIIKYEKKNYSWATLADFGAEKDGQFAAVHVIEKEIAGDWKRHIETKDYIWVIDNKAITNRPDMWGHRGFAREVAAVLQQKLAPEEQFLAAKPIKHYIDFAPVSSSNPFSLGIENTECALICKRIAGTYISSINYQQSNILMAQRLARVDSKPIDLIVDCTNYVMLDIGQPMHAFDAEKITSHKLVGRCAHKGEKLQLLDGEIIELTPEDFVISDGNEPVALAGIMGGMSTSVSKTTHSLYIEAANFDASAIRKTAARHKKRTESSARFEKSLDPNNNTQALLRFIKLLDVLEVPYQSADAIASIGQLSQEKIIEVTHQEITTIIGMHISSDNVQKYLMQLGFGVEVKHEVKDTSKVIYHVTVPTYRSTKDVTIKQDIIEEIARFVGYTNIPPLLPSRQMNPFDITGVTRTRQIKQQLAYGSRMNEVQTYAFYDEEFIKQLNYDPQDTLQLAQPFSQNIKRLVTSLVPNLLKCVLLNSTKEDELRFFELNRIWFTDRESVESRELAGIFYHKKEHVDFYTCKAQVDKLCASLGLKVAWRKITQPVDPWYNVHQTAELVYEDQIIATAGMVSTKFLHTIVEGSAFVFEINGDFLLNIEPKQRKFKPLFKYQDVSLDISMMVPLTVTVAQLSDTIVKADKRIQEVNLVDFFEKEEWQNQKSITMRFVLYDDQKTMVKEEIDTVYSAVAKAVQSLGANIR